MYKLKSIISATFSEEEISVKSSSFLYTGTPPIALFFGPEKNHRIIGKTVLKEDLFSTKWENQALKNARVR